MAIGVKFVDVIPSSVENAVEVKRYEYEGFIYMCLQGVTGGTELGGDIAIAVLRPVRPAVGQASYHLVSYTPLTYTRSDVAIFLRNGDFKVVKRDDCNLI